MTLTDTQTHILRTLRENLRGVPHIVFPKGDLIVLQAEGYVHVEHGLARLTYAGAAALARVAETGQDA